VGTVHASAERAIAAPPQRVYELIADYREARPRLLPDSYVDYTVESGGSGEGTVVTYTLHAAKRERPYRMVVAEPQPGWVLEEADAGSSLVTTWTVAPADTGSRVRIHTRWEGAGGVGGFFERTFAPKGLGRIYEQILDRLESEATAPGIGS
jgi:uncharacterized protein YndB with AHSA1/START domain